MKLPWNNKKKRVYSFKTQRFLYVKMYALTFSFATSYNRCAKKVVLLDILNDKSIGKVISNSFVGKIFSFFLPK